MEVSEIGQFVKLSQEQRVGKKVVSISGLIELMKSPKHFYSKYILKEDDETSAAAEKGKLIHKAVLEPEKFHEEYAVLDSKETYLVTADDLKERLKMFDVKPKGNKSDLIQQVLSVQPDAKIWDLYLKEAEQSGKQLVTAAEYLMCQRIIEEVENHAWLKRTPKEKANEVAGYWKHPSGVYISFRLDSLFFGKNGRPIILDLKTTSDASPDTFSKTIWNNKLFVQAACYVDAVKAITGLEPLYCWAVVETSAPYNLEVYSADDGMLSAGHNVYNKQILKYLECLELGEWHGYTNGNVNPIALPHWAFGKLEEYAEQEIEFQQGETNEN